MNHILGFVTWTADPIAFSLGNLQVRWYGILLATGFVLAYFTLQKIFQKENISQKTLDKFAIWTIIWCIIGLRLGHFLFYEPEYLVQHPLQVLLPFDEEWKFIGYGGLASHGGALAMLLWVIYFCYTRKMNFFWLLDRLCIAVPIAAAFVRCGNLMNHEIVGSVTDVPWAFNFIHGGVDADGSPIAGTYRHPSQLYESLVYLSLYISLVIYYFKFAKGKVPPGRAAGIMITVIFVARFFIEFLKADQVAKEAGMSLNIGQWLSIPFALIGIGLIVYSIIKKKECPQYVEPAEKKK
ncbi:MAG: prolipoprotein diacylglyceryl transferase [Bacteroidales bacterium]|nr:prolipoprotein diacylglyceryl transferase [Bacteroidales bacterium]